MDRVVVCGTTDGSSTLPGDTTTNFPQLSLLFRSFSIKRLQRRHLL